MNWRDENSLKNFLISWWSESRIITSDSNLTQNITRETTEVEKKRDGSRFQTHSRVNGTLRRWHVLLGNSEDGSIRKNILS